MAQVETAEQVEMLVPLAVGVCSTWLRNYPCWVVALPLSGKL